MKRTAPEADAFFTEIPKSIGLICYVEFKKLCGLGQIEWQLYKVFQNDGSLQSFSDYREHKLLILPEYFHKSAGELLFISGNKKIPNHERLGITVALEAPPGFEPGNKGFADLCLTTWLWRHKNGAGYEIRTRDFHLGKVTLYH